MTATYDMPQSTLTGTETPYQYWILRYVPNTVRQEFVNVGVVVGREDDWAVRAISNWDHAGRLGGDPSRAATWVEQLTEEAEASQRLPLPEISSATALSTSEISRRQALHNNHVQIATGGPLVTTDAHSGAAMMFDLLVHDPDPQPRRTRAVTRLRRQLGDTLRQWASQPFSASRSVEANPSVSAATMRLPAKFNFLAANGRLSLHHAWAFESGTTATDLLVRFRAWEVPVRDLRESGGSVTLHNTEEPQTLDQDVPLTVLFSEPNPAETDRLEVLEEARAFCHQYEIEMIPENEPERLLRILS